MIITQEVFMEIRNLESFIQVAELGSFTKAAESLGYTQSSADTMRGVYGMCLTIFNMPCAFITPITIRKRKRDSESYP